MSGAYLPVRLSHLLRHCSVGAIVRGPDYLMTVKDVREWTARGGNPAGQIIPYVSQVRSVLGIEQELRAPPIAKQLDNGQVDGVCIPVVRFPAWMRCPSCGLLYYKPWRGLEIGEKPRCQYEDRKACKGKPELEQVQWVLVHAAGHLADVPWHFLAHGDAKNPDQKQCRRDREKPYLRLVDQDSSHRTICCSECNASANLGDSISLGFGSAWRQPWVPEPPDASDDPGVVLEVNDVRVHSPATRTALVIPPESRIRKGSVVDRLYSSSQKRQDIEAARTGLARRSTLRRIASEFRCSVHDVEDALREIEQGYPLYDQQFTDDTLSESEYQALTEEIPDLADDEDFVTTHYTSTWKRMATEFAADSKLTRIIRSIDHLIGVRRLKEIMVLDGFRRRVDSDEEKNLLVPPDIIGESDWLPALELFGEGIFFTIREDVLSEWESNDAVSKRADTVDDRFGAADLRFERELTPSGRFLLLHTLAHLCIRHVEMEAGYPAASLKEHIYCAAGKKPMSGILIYVATPDVAGSLGGLVELAEPKRFLPLLSGVFEHAEWCSLDPVCSEHEGQGPSLLNRAACHACALVPEPSCAYGNVLLDRTFIKGDERTVIRAFLDCVG